MDELKEILKKCFGKEKDEKSHAVAMLILFGLFLILVTVTVRLGSNNVEPNGNLNTSNNYTYSVIYDDNSYIISGEKKDNKELLSVVLNNNTTNISEYLIVDNSYYKMINNNYEKINSLDFYFKYLDKDKILGLIDFDSCIEKGSYICSIETIKFANTFSDTLVGDFNPNVVVFISKDKEEIKNIRIELDDYITALVGNYHRFKIEMKYGE